MTAPDPRPTWKDLLGKLLGAVVVLFSPITFLVVVFIILTWGLFIEPLFQGHF
jgi:hypothetical protein